MTQVRGLVCGCDNAVTTSSTGESGKPLDLRFNRWGKSNFGKVSIGQAGNDRERQDAQLRKRPCRGHCGTKSR